ncbi:MAG: SPOR domain-containing protein [Nitrococcus sp.]|nr:SPOR domain-containing protein [Nitrococcus sp.]
MARQPRQRMHQASRHSGDGQPLLPGWVWGLAGLSVGLLVALGVYLRYPPPNNSAAVSSLFWSHERSAGAPLGEATDDTPGSNDESSLPRFEFYKLLPNQEVGVLTPKPNIEPPGAKPSMAEDWADAQHQRPQIVEAIPREIEQAKAGYLLQAGSFRNPDDADQLKASLALLGVEASIQNVKLATGETWHRVRIGPFSNRQRLSKIRKRLQVNNIHTIVLKHDG